MLYKQMNSQACRRRSRRARRTVLDALARLKTPVHTATRTAVLELLEDPYWGLRADAARVLQAQRARKDLPVVVRRAIDEALAARLESEPDPYVRFWLRAR